MNDGIFPVIKTRLVGVTKNGKDTPEHCCRSELMHSENAPNYIFSMFKAFCEDIKLEISGTLSYTESPSTKL